jgi:glycosyltransferase involved in cell wall biosynthesis
MSQPLVSIHVITYNQQQFVRETLNSVLSQDYSNLEIVVADDGSTDGTVDVILEYARAYPGRIVPLVSGPNLGITGNSNRGLRACKGKYIAFLGGDDLMLPEKIRLQVTYMETNPDCDVCYHDMEVFDSVSGAVLSLFSEISKPVTGRIREAIRYGTVNCASASMYRTLKIPKNGFDESLPVVSDWLFTIQALSSGGRLGFIDAVLGRYRRHSGNVTNIDSPFRTRGFADTMQTCAICMSLYPVYLSDVIVRMSAILRESRWLSGGKFYSRFLWASLRLRISIKTIGGLIVFYFSARKIRL